MYPMWYTGHASSMCPLWPMHFMTSCLHVAQQKRRSTVPMRRSLMAPLRGMLRSYNAVSVTSTSDKRSTSSRENKPNWMWDTCGSPHMARYTGARAGPGDPRRRARGGQKKTCHPRQSSSVVLALLAGTWPICGSTATMHRGCPGPRYL